MIHTGRPEGLTVTVGGKPVKPLGPPAHTVSNISLKAAALEAGTAAAVPAAQPGAAPADGGTPAAFRTGTQDD